MKSKRRRTYRVLELLAGLEAVGASRAVICAALLDHAISQPTFRTDGGLDSFLRRHRITLKLRRETVAGWLLPEEVAELRGTAGALVSIGGGRP